MSELKPGLYAVFETSLGKITCRLVDDYHALTKVSGEPIYPR